MGRIIIKKVQPTLASKKLYNFGRQSVMRQVYNPQINDETLVEQDTTSEIKKIEEEKNNETKIDTVMMTTNEKIELANAILSDKPQFKAKRIKNDKGLIERKENTIILTEDNRELLKD